MYRRYSISLFLVCPYHTRDSPVSNTEALYTHIPQVVQLLWKSARVHARAFNWVFWVKKLV